jgi:hypothetical protein
VMYGRDLSVDGTKLDGIEASADVTDTANVTAAGALMDSELTSEASVKALDQGVATTDSPTFASINVNGLVTSDDFQIDLGTTTAAAEITTPSSISGFQAFRVKNTHTEGTLAFGTTLGQARIQAYGAMGAADPLNIDVGSITAIGIDATGQVGIGTTSPASNLHINSTDTTAGLQITNSATGSAETDGFHITVGSGGFTSLSAKENTGMAFLTGGTERARFSSGGIFLIGRTATGILAEEAGFMLKPDGLLLTAKDGTAEQTHVEFVNNADVTAARVGTIKTSGSTSSDYRLKTDAQPMTGATDRLKALNPVNFQWILDGTRVDGFLAHEVADVVPEAISGDKDAVDEDGNPDYQGIDQSKLVPLLVATIQELEARITQLENN